MPLWFLPLAKGLAHEECDAVSQDFLDLFRAYAELQRVIEAGKPLRKLKSKDANYCIYRTPGGWKIQVLAPTAGEWDYIDDIFTPDGQSLCMRFGWNYFEQHGTIYKPTDDDLTNIWKW